MYGAPQGYPAPGGNAAYTMMPPGAGGYGPPGGGYGGQTYGAGGGYSGHGYQGQTPRPVNIPSAGFSSLLSALLPPAWRRTRLCRL
jgi:hypothetical protein